MTVWYVTDELEGAWKEATGAYFKIQCRSLHDRARKNKKNLGPRITASCLNLNQRSPEKSDWGMLTIQLFCVFVTIMSCCNLTITLKHKRRRSSQVRTSFLGTLKACAFLNYYYEHVVVTCEKNSAGTNWQNFKMVIHNIKISHRQYIFNFSPQNIYNFILIICKHVLRCICTKCRMSIITMVLHFLKANRTKTNHSPHKTTTLKAAPHIKFPDPALSVSSAVPTSELHARDTKLRWCTFHA
jgi:hypothetical protein